METQTKEEWRPVIGYEGLYEVSNMGRVRNGEHRTGQHKPNIIMKQRVINGGYYGLTLYKDTKKKFHLIHRIVYEAFVGSIPVHDRQCKGKTDEVFEINHIDEDKSNNRVSNLELITKKQNINYGSRTKLAASKLSKKVYQYTEDYELIKIWDSVADCHRIGGFNAGDVASFCRGTKKYCRGFIWSYIPIEKKYPSKSTNSNQNTMTQSSI